MSRKTYNHNGFNLAKCKELNLDPADLMILRWFCDFYPRMNKTIKDNKEYGWVHYGYLIENLQIIYLKEQRLSQKFKNYCELLLLEKIEINTKNGKKIFYRMTENFTELFYSEYIISHTEKNIDGSDAIYKKLNMQHTEKNIGAYIYDSSTTDSSTNKEKNTKTFTKPSKEEIQEYITEKNLPMNAEQVLSYYDSTDWVKKNGKPVVNWKSTIKNWNRPTVAERKTEIENISFEIKEKNKNFTPYQRLDKILISKGSYRNDMQVKNILQMDECKQWLKQVESNKTFEAILEDIQNNMEAQNELKIAYISFLEKFKTSKKQIDDDIKEKLPLFLARCQHIRYTAVIEGLSTITKANYNDYMQKQSENNLPFISHFDYIIQRIEVIDKDITRLLERLAKIMYT